MLILPFVVLHCFLSVGTACEFWLFVFLLYFILYVILFELLVMGRPMDMTKSFKHNYLSCALYL
jgi:hypothetical protein